MGGELRHVAHTAHVTAARHGWLVLRPNRTLAPACTRHGFTRALLGLWPNRTLVPACTAARTTLVGSRVSALITRLPASTFPIGMAGKLPFRCPSYDASDLLCFNKRQRRPFNLLILSEIVQVLYRMITAAIIVVAVLPREAAGLRLVHRRDGSRWHATLERLLTARPHG